MAAQTPAQKAAATRRRNRAMQQNTFLANLVKSLADIGLLPEEGKADARAMALHRYALDTVCASDLLDRLNTAAERKKQAPKPVTRLRPYRFVAVRIRDGFKKKSPMQLCSEMGEDFENPTIAGQVEKYLLKQRGEGTVKKNRDGTFSTT